MTVRRVLIIEDNPRLLAILKSILETKTNWKVDTVSQGEEAILLINRCKPDLILLDRSLPDIHGDTICQYVRTVLEKKHLYDPYICMITGETSTSSKIQAYYMGIDDYICKPIDYEELPVRLKLMSTRRENHTDALPLKQNDLVEIETKYLCIYFTGKVIVRLSDRRTKELCLTETELRLLKFLVKNPGQYVSKETLISLWGSSCVSPGIINTNIYRIRKKLSEASNLIRGSRQHGYCYNDSLMTEEQDYAEQIA
ncbi:MAG: response regulator transcription factor [Okeania sp. SIO2F4]|uniref:response regulator transcription factor n=1 Tax=Okeania sp. SIO2F4 TaxID=2607790 RepID=UPI00142A75B2|nr:response regulator transcription factor [Okeania sp. SIO2F4]NES01790.1 response regulator transcription factor [Okeania sp. SIO2F4]